MNAYKTNHVFYICVLALSILVTFSSLCVSVEELRSVLSGIGCGGVASIIIAWIIDVMNCKNRKVLNDNVLNQIFQQFDLSVQYEMRTVIEECALRNPSIDTEKDYTLGEIKRIVENEDGSIDDWKRHYHNLGVAFSTVDPSVILSYDPSEKHAELYTSILQGHISHNSYSTIMSMGAINACAEDGSTLEYNMLCFDIENMDRIFNIRGKSFDLKRV